MTLFIAFGQFHIPAIKIMDVQRGTVTKTHNIQE